MSILIKGMEMPKGADEHRLIIRANGQVIIDKKTYWEEAKAIPVPKHGRLIDADALTFSRIRIAYEDGFIGGYNAVVMSCAIKDAPTIIPASEEGE